ncbi:histidine phosphatase family protein [Gordonia sp. (in: high G+C Gram-positive bacteria)]|uniref:histidine phosphatase family protein n=1 Tax=Gordonia sp. (in: high G+C Gram-positive bacteria) TaxID=84139 RepID=UPI003C777541
MGVLYIVRHGQAPAHAYSTDPDSVGGPGLTDLGFAQARAAGVALARQVKTFDAVFCGDLPRQRATAASIAEAFDSLPDATVDADWNEYVTPTVPEGDDIYAGGGQPFQDALTHALGAWVNGAAVGPETFEDFVGRTRTAAARAAEAAGSGKNVLVVSSAGTITQLVAQLWNVPSESWPAMSRTFVNTAISKVLSGKRGLTLVSFNDHAHVADTTSGLLTYR